MEAAPAELLEQFAQVKLRKRSLAQTLKNALKILHRNFLKKLSTMTRRRKGKTIKVSTMMTRKLLRKMAKRSRTLAELSLKYAHFLRLVSADMALGVKICT